jgi:hypothetical protein
MADPPRPVIVPPAKPTVPVSPTPPQPLDERRIWFKYARRSAGNWDRNAAPLPVIGNRVTAYLEVMDYYAALGEAVRATRSDMADFVYIAGWGFDLTAFIDPPGAKPRQTIGEILELAVKRKVEVRVILPAQPKEGQEDSLKLVAKLGGGAVLDPYLI